MSVGGGGDSLSVTVCEISQDLQKLLKEFRFRKQTASAAALISKTNYIIKFNAMLFLRSRAFHQQCA
jgi:hypothetical protein